MLLETTPAWTGSTMAGHTNRSQNRPTKARPRFAEPNLASVASTSAASAVRISLMQPLDHDATDVVALPWYDGSLGHNLEHHLIGGLQQTLHRRCGRSPIFDRKILACLHAVDDVYDDWLQCLLEEPRAVQFHEASSDVSQDGVLAEEELGLRFKELVLFANETCKCVRVSSTAFGMVSFSSPTSWPAELKMVAIETPMWPSL